MTNNITPQDKLIMMMQLRSNLQRPHFNNRKITLDDLSKQEQEVINEYKDKQIVKDILANLKSKSFKFNFNIF